MSRRITVVASEVLGVPGTGGPGTADSLLAVALGRHGHRVELLVAPGREVGRPNPDWEAAYAGAEVQIRPLEYRLDVQPHFLAATAEVLAALRADPPEIVIVDDWRGLGYAALRSRQLAFALPDTAFVIYCHGPGRALTGSARKVPDTLARFGEDVAERACIEFADAVVSPSRWLLGWMRDHRWPVPESARVIPYLWQSVALGATPPQAATGSPVQRLAFFGQLREGKGIRVYADSLRQLDPGLLTGIELLFVGRESPRWTAASVEEALGAGVAGSVSSIRFEGRLERSDALRELLLPGTLVVMPSLVDNSPNTVAECLEHGIPFVTTRVGGIPELIDDEDQDRVLCAPSPDELAVALARALSSRPEFTPARPTRAGAASLDAWLELVDGLTPRRPPQSPPAKRVAVVANGEEALRRARRLANRTPAAETEVISAETRLVGLDQATADWVLFLDHEDDPDDELLDALLSAQAASQADAVTTGTRSGEGDGLQLFLGDPGALGLVLNQYGVLGLVRRSSAAAHLTSEAALDPDWPLFARLARAGGRIVSIPVPLATHSGRPGMVGDVPGDGLVVLEAFEGPAAAPVEDLPQLTATLGAAVQRLEARQPVTSVVHGGLIRRAIRVIRSDGVVGLARRAQARVGRNDG